MRRPQGYATLIGPTTVNGRPIGPKALQGGAAFGMHECDTASCAHCQRVMHIPVRCDPADLGGLCKQCMGIICPACVGKGCEPLEKKLRRMEQRGAALRSYGLA